MKLFEIAKISTLGALLLVIFSLPMLTATQLVGVLGSHSARTSLGLRALSDESTFTLNSSNDFNVSFTSKGTHRFVEVTNPSNQTVNFVVRLIDPSKIPNGSKLESDSHTIADLGSTEYNFSAPLSLEAHQSIILSIDTNNASADRGTAVLSIIED